MRLASMDFGVKNGQFTAKIFLQITESKRLRGNGLEVLCKVSVKVQNCICKKIEQEYPTNVMYFISIYAIFYG